MKLKSEILYEFLRAIIFPIMLLSFIAVFIFQLSFRNFVNNEELNRQNKIEQLTKNLFLDQQQGLSIKSIDKYMWYLSELDLDVIFYDNNDKELYS
ncbi:MAG: sensor histidine kinase, partial [Finegoldia magna]|nr:sensor histidine kinase [Finegoldia magna]